MTLFIIMISSFASAELYNIDFTSGNFVEPTDNNCSIGTSSTGNFASSTRAIDNLNLSIISNCGLLIDDKFIYMLESRLKNALTTSDPDYLGTHKASIDGFNTSYYWSRSTGGGGEYYYNPTFLVDLEELTFVDNNTNINFTSIVDTDIATALTNYNPLITFIDSDGNAVWTYSKGDPRFIYDGSGNKLSFNHLRNFTKHTQNIDVSGNFSNFTTDRDLQFQYIAITYSIDGTGLKSSYNQNMSWTMYNFSIVNATDLCSQDVIYTNSSILSLKFDDYFNYSIPYVCNGWEGTLKNNFANGVLNFTDNSQLDFVTHTFITDNVVSTEFDFTLENFQGFGFGLYTNQSGLGNEFTLNFFMVGKTLYFGNTSLFTDLKLNTVYNIKMVQFTNSDAFTFVLTRGSTTLVNSEIQEQYDFRPNGISFFDVALNSGFLVDNLVIYGGTEKLFDNSFVADQVILADSKTSLEFKNGIIKFADDLGFKGNAGHLIFYMIFLVFINISLIVTHAKQNWSLSEKTLITVNIVFLILGFALTFVPFWVIFLIFVFGLLFTILAMKGGNSSE